MHFEIGEGRRVRRPPPSSPGGGRVSGGGHSAAATDTESIEGRPRQRGPPPPAAVRARVRAAAAAAAPAPGRQKELMRILTGCQRERFGSFSVLVLAPKRGAEPGQKEAEEFLWWGSAAPSGSGPGGRSGVGRGRPPFPGPAADALSRPFGLCAEPVLDGARDPVRLVGAPVAVPGAGSRQKPWLTPLPLSLPWSGSAAPQCQLTAPRRHLASPRAAGFAPLIAHSPPPPPPPPRPLAELSLPLQKEVLWKGLLCVGPSGLGRPRRRVADKSSC